MLNLTRHHDFQVFLSPSDNSQALTNPPSFNWPQPTVDHKYTLELKSDIESQSSNKVNKQWQNVSSPFQLSNKLEEGEHQWRLIDEAGNSSDWVKFTITAETPEYLAPTAKDLFALCQNKDQFLMYFDEDIDTIKQGLVDAGGSLSSIHTILKSTAQLAVEEGKIVYPNHYKRGMEAGKRTAITNVREWIDRDLISLCLLYKVWQDQESGQKAMQLLLELAQWSPEGTASLLRPCTWGDEVGLSLSRNLFLAYHWLSPLLNEAEKSYIRPMLIRIAYQMEERLNQDEFHQFPGHSHTSRLPAYLGVAALALHKEFDVEVCERWLNYALMIYRGVLPFYGGSDGSWAEGPFYSSSYTKWQHPFFLSVERLSGFSFYQHPFYQNYYQFAMDFVAPEREVHPFGDGFWCKRESVEWPGFFSQNPLRVYAARFGDQQAKQLSETLESKINTYSLHLLDIIPTVKQLQFEQNRSDQASPKELSPTDSSQGYYKFYPYAGFGVARFNQQDLLFRASPFGNSSHRHADQGNFALFDQGKEILIPTGSYGYCFGSAHHSDWTRTTKAHNLPLIDGVGQILDDEKSVASVISEQSGNGWKSINIDLSKSYQGVDSFVRTLVLIEDHCLIVWDKIQLKQAQSLQWRCHTSLKANMLADPQTLNLTAEDIDYHCQLFIAPQAFGSQPLNSQQISNQKSLKATIEHGYEEEILFPQKVESDANTDVYHIEWNLAPAQSHNVVMSCLKKSIEIKSEGDSIRLRLEAGDEVILES